MKQTVFKRKKDGVFFYLIFPRFHPQHNGRACFRDVDINNCEHFTMDEVINNRAEFEQVDGEMDFYTAIKDDQVVRVNKYGELMRNPRVEEDAKYRLKDATDGRKYQIDMVGAWDEEKSAYRLIYSKSKKEQLCGYDTDFKV